MKWLIIIIALIVIVGGTIYFALTQSVPDSSSSAIAAPNFVLADYAGNTVRFSDFAGKIAVINSWAAWCPFCKKELADFAALQQAFPEIAVIAIDRAESLEKAKGFTDSLGITDDMIFLLDPQDMFYKSIGGFSMPETIFVNKEGNIVLHKRGPITLEEMKSLVEPML